jgi:hypothetical protein
MSKAKVQFPDGKGGFIEIEGDVHQGSMANAQKQAEVAGRLAESEGHDHMLNVLKFEQVRARELNLTPDQRAFAMTLLVIAMRENFAGGTDAFDNINREAYDYYIKNN